MRQQPQQLEIEKKQKILHLKVTNSFSIKHDSYELACDFSRLKKKKNSFGLSQTIKSSDITNVSGLKTH